jgi:hypothetical protein
MYADDFLGTNGDVQALGDNASGIQAGISVASLGRFVLFILAFASVCEQIARLVAALHIQTVWRGRRARRYVVGRIQAANADAIIYEKRQNASIVIQALMRGHNARRFAAEIQNGNEYLQGLNAVYILNCTRRSELRSIRQLMAREGMVSLQSAAEEQLRKLAAGEISERVDDRGPEPEAQLTNSVNDRPCASLHMCVYRL